MEDEILKFVWKKMAEENIYNTYSFAEIQRYLSGSMSTTEMHDMERAALQDPFLADAIEGYRNADANTALKHINEIEITINGKHVDAKIISINKNKKQWGRIALMVASAAAAIIAGVYLFNTNNSNKTNVAQVKKNVKSISSTQKNEVQKNDTAFVITNTTDAAKKDNSIATIGKKNKEITADGAATVNLTTTALNDLNIAAVQDTEELTKSDHIESSTQITKIISTAKPNNLSDNLLGKVAGANVSNEKKDIYLNNNLIALTGRVFDNIGKAVPNAMINISGTNTTAITDANGTFKISISDTVSKATISAIGYDAKEIALASTDKNIIFLQQNNTMLNDVVVTALGIKKETTKITILADKKMATPVGGWNVYEGYVQGKLSLIQDSIENDFNTYGDIVELEFTIDEDGNPYDFTVVSDNDEVLDKKIIDAVAEGPRWIRKSKNKKARLKIKF